MVKRPCLDCGTLIVSSRRCRQCERGRERQRPSPSRRGYGTAHQSARSELEAMLPGPCGYGCGAWLVPGGAWVAAHVVDGDAGAGWLASCRTCNERAKARYHAPSAAGPYA